MILPAQLRIGTWVKMHDGRKLYIGSIDPDGSNPDNPTKMFALYLSDEKNGFGQWVPAASVKSVHGKNPYQDQPWNRPTDLGVASWQANKSGTTFMTEYVHKVKGGWRVTSHQTGKNFGTYPSKPAAEKRLSQIHKFRSKDEILHVKPEGRFMLKPNEPIRESKQCNWCGKPVPQGK